MFWIIRWIGCGSPKPRIYSPPEHVGEQHEGGDVTRARARPLRGHVFCDDLIQQVTDRPWRHRTVKELAVAKWWLINSIIE